MTFKKAVHDFGPFGDEDALAFVFEGAPHSGVGLELGRIKRGDFADVKHGVGIESRMGAEFHEIRSAGMSFQLEKSVKSALLRGIQVRLVLMRL